MIEPDKAHFARALANELLETRGVLEDLAVQLCLDPIVFERHPEPLQHFDRLAQVIGEVAAVLRHNGPWEGAVAAVRLEDVRQRLASIRRMSPNT